MGQYWKLVCWDKQLKSSNLGKLKNFFHCSSHEIFGFASGALSLKRERRGPLGRGAPVENLPINILQEIISKLYGRDKEAFLRASRRIAGKIYEELYSGLSWQGCRIACISNHTYEVPDPLICAGIDVELEADETFYRYVEDNFQEISWKITDDEIWKAKMVEQAMNGEEEYPAKFVVLNESRKEYVVTKRQDFITVILCLICWSDDFSVSIRTDYEIYQGLWAWDRISIFSQDEFKPVAARYNNVTKLVYRIAREIVDEDMRGRISI